MNLVLYSIVGQKSGMGLTGLELEFGKTAFLSDSRGASISLLSSLRLSDRGPHFFAGCQLRTAPSF